MESGQMMAMAYALVGPERCWKALRQPELAEKFDELVWEFAQRLHPGAAQRTRGLDRHRTATHERRGRRAERGKAVTPRPTDEAGAEEVLWSFSQRQQGQGTSVGWVLTLIEAMRAEWHCTLHQALFEESLNAALELWPAMMARYGVDPGLGYVDRARQRAKQRAREWIAANYTVVKGTKSRAQRA